MAKLTPMMEQYTDLKERYSDCILFFRLGDFYEMFFEDALTASRELEITLTGRDCGLEEKAPMCGVPHHSADGYIARLVEKGYKVAICEQVEDPSKAKGIVKRDVVRIITSGTITDMDKLDEKSNNYLASLYVGRKGIGISYVDITTGDSYTTEILGTGPESLSKCIDEIGKIAPSELLVNTGVEGDFCAELQSRFDEVRTLEGWYFEKELCISNIISQFKVHSLSGIGMDASSFAAISLGALLEYLKVTQKQSLDHISSVNVYIVENYMMLDMSTRRNLELLETIRGKSKKGSLLSVLDKTATAMGGRLIKSWIESPLLDKYEIERRSAVVESLTEDITMMDQLDEKLKQIYDMERLVGKLVYGNCNARDLISLKHSISQLPHIVKSLEDSESQELRQMGEGMDILWDLYELVDSAIEEEPPIGIKEGNIIKENYSPELKELRDIALNGKSYLSRIEERERARTGIKNLKIKYNKVFGYFIELSKSNIDKAPSDYIRKQTLANAERYITEELKEIENKILGSEDRMVELEYEIFGEIREKLRANSQRIQSTARSISKIDVLNSFAKAAYLNNYIRPEILEDGSLYIENGRHPVVEKMVAEGRFISNDTYMNGESDRMMIITGPNMSGKSTYMRQVALITLMAQIGSFVPADSAKISVADRIFTRIGASDDLSEGQSTFMVEMSEVANILNNATEKSLIVLDEIGRGTSTYDGLSIAWSVVEYISGKSNLGAKTLFATHYHELTELEEVLEGVKNYRVAVEEKPGEDIVFLRKIERGGADRSYGIEVAKLAGVRPEVIARAAEILRKLEENDLNKKSPSQLSIFSEESREESKTIRESGMSYSASAVQSEKEDSEYEEIVAEIVGLDIMNMSPLDSINILHSLWKKSVKIKG